MSERQATPRPEARRTNDRRNSTDDRSRTDAETTGGTDASNTTAESRIASEQRAREIYRLRIEEQLTLKQIGQRFGIGAERTRQILKRHCHTNRIAYPSHVVRRTR